MTDHGHILDRLDDYLDGSLSEEEQRSIAHHLETCASCRQEAEAMKSLLEMARGLPDSIDPRRDLWPDIRVRIQPQSARAPRGPRWILRPRWAFAGAVAAAAVIVIALFRPTGPATERDAAESQDLRAGIPTYVTPLVQAFEQECMGAGKQLLASVASSENPLGPEAAAAIEQNIHPLDLAIEETKSALEENPGDPKLLQMLTSQYQRKLSLLYRAIRLAGEA